MIKKMIPSVITLGLVIVSLVIYHHFFAMKVAYIDIPKVFNQFEMKKELQDKYKVVESGRKRLLDSLAFNLQILSKKLKDDQSNKELMYEFDTKREDYFKRKKMIEQDNVALSNQYDKQILEQMTQYILDYGKRKHYDYILGTDGNGVLMYANQAFDKSEEIIKVINNKYKGID